MEIGLKIDRVTCVILRHLVLQCESAQYSPPIILHMHIAVKEKSLKSDFQK